MERLGSALHTVDSWVILGGVLGGNGARDPPSFSLSLGEQAGAEVEADCACVLPSHALRVCGRTVI